MSSFTGRKMNIVIVGGSNTGLMNGVVLKRLGHNVHILEQNAQSQRTDLAAGITTHETFEKFMEIHDRTEEAWCVPTPGLQFLDKTSAVKRSVNKPLQLTSWSVIYHHLRANFDGFASSFCSDPPKADEKDGDAVFERGKRVTNLANDGEGVIVFYEDLLNNDEKRSVKADMVIIADGANSKLRTALFPSVKRLYAGYVAFRGTVPESEVSEEAQKIFDPKITYYTYKNGYILLYIIPGYDGSVAPGRRRYNWVWYHPLAASSPSFTEIMTDTSGNLHRNTLPIGAMQPSAWAQYVTLAEQVMCPPFAEMIRKTKQPFITAISDVASPRATALESKVIIAGEALNLMRPHMALSTTQSATQALLLERVFKDELTLREWEKEVLHFGRIKALTTNAFGTFMLYGYLTAAGWLVKLAGAYVLPFSLFSSLGSPGSGKKRD